MCIRDRDDILPLFEQQLEKTGVSYFDYYLLHALNGACLLYTSLVSVMFSFTPDDLTRLRLLAPRGSLYAALLKSEEQMCIRDSQRAENGGRKPRDAAGRGPHRGRGRRKAARAGIDFRRL